MKGIKRNGMKMIAYFRQDTVIGVCTFKGKLIIATTKGVYSYPRTRGPRYLSKVDAIESTLKKTRGV